LTDIEQSGAIQVDHVLDAVAESLSGLVGYSSGADDEFQRIFESLFYWACRNEVQTKIGVELEHEVLQQFVIVLSDENTVAAHGMELQKLSISKVSGSVCITCTDRNGSNYSHGGFRLFIACTATRNIMLGARGIELLRQYQNVKALIEPNGRMIRFPRKEKPRAAVLRYLAATMEPDRHYTEHEVNDHLGHFYPDYALLRRSLIVSGLLRRTRDGSVYEVV